MRASALSHTFFSQRPVVEPVQFSSNAVLAEQEPDCGVFLGAKLPDFRAAHAALISDKSLQDERNWCVELLLTKLENTLGQSGCSKEKVAALLSDAAKGLQASAPEDLRRVVMSILPKPILAPENEGFPKPINEFVQRYLAGQIQAPKFDLRQLSTPEQAEELWRSVRWAYATSGLPKLSHAFGISDVLNDEAGSLGQYAPALDTQRDPNANYDSRTSISVVSRMAWNAETRQALCVQYPFVPANMRCVTDIDSARAAIAVGLCPVVSFTKFNRQERLAAAEEFGPRAFITVRSGAAEQEVAREILKGGGNVCLEMANANTPRSGRMVRELKKEFPASFIMVGNVGSPEGYWFAVESGADVVKLGRGPGAGCTTPEETGISPGQVTLLYECSMVQTYLLLFYGKDVPMCLDGGLSTAGHLVVGGMLGAETFMMGSKFAVCEESPAEVFVDDRGVEYVHYFGEASAYAAGLDGITERATPQGINGFLRRNGSYASVVRALAGGLRGGVADEGFRSFSEFVGDNRNLFARLKTEGSQRETATRLSTMPDVQLKTPGRFVGGA